MPAARPLRAEAPRLGSGRNALRPPQADMSMEEMGGDITAPPCLPPPWPIKLSNQDSDPQSQEKGPDAKNTAALATLLLSGSWLLTGRGVPPALLPAIGTFTWTQEQRGELGGERGTEKAAAAPPWDSRSSRVTVPALGTVSRCVHSGPATAGSWLPLDGSCQPQFCPQNTNLHAAAKPPRIMLEIKEADPSLLFCRWDFMDSADIGQGLD